MNKPFILLLFIAAAVFAQNGEGAAPDSTNGKRVYAHTSLGDDDFTRSLQANTRRRWKSSTEPDAPRAALTFP
jgi:hypothetical protein